MGMVKRMTTPAVYRNINVTSIDTDAYLTDDENIGFTPRVVGRERRTKRRFPIELPAELCVRGMHFRGITVNIRDRKSTRLNSSHLGISYAVFCLKKKK